MLNTMSIKYPQAGFQKGNQLAKLAENPGRKVFEIEEAQLKEMRSNLNWLLAYIKAVRSGKATERQDKAFLKLEKVLLKIMDKLHANRQQTDITSGGEKIIPMFLPSEIIEKYNLNDKKLGIDSQPENNSQGQS